jgi:hypothetical protein
MAISRGFWVGYSARPLAWCDVLQARASCREVDGVTGLSPVSFCWPWRSVVCVAGVLVRIVGRLFSNLQYVNDETIYWDIDVI